MAKWPLQFESLQKRKVLKPQDSPLSPDNITSTTQHATITGVIASLSQLKPSRYFNGEITDGGGIIRMVVFEALTWW